MENIYTLHYTFSGIYCAVYKTYYCSLKLRIEVSNASFSRIASYIYIEYRDTYYHNINKTIVVRTCVCTERSLEAIQLPLNCKTFV